MVNMWKFTKEDLEKLDIPDNYKRAIEQGKYLLCKIARFQVRHIVTEGDAVTFEGFEEFYFFLHRHRDIPNFWVISEVITGLPICGGSTCPEDVKVMARDRLNTAGAERVKEAQEGHIKTRWWYPPSGYPPDQEFSVGQEWLANKRHPSFF